MHWAAMADSKDEEKMEEDWEYYDDNNVLPDFAPIPSDSRVKV